MQGNVKEIIGRLFGRGGAKPPKALPRDAVRHDGVDEMVFGNYSDDSPRFKRLAVEEAPRIAPDVPDPDPLDFTQATPEEIKAWQVRARAAKAAREQASPYDAWEDLTRDMFYSYHHSQVPELREVDGLDPSVAHHQKIIGAAMAQEEHARARNITRDQPVPAACATMAATERLKSALTEELIEQARQSEEFERARDEAEAAQQELDDLRNDAQQQHDQDGQVDPGVVDAIKQAVKDKRGAQQRAAQAAQATPVPMDHAALKAIQEAVRAGEEAAERAQAMPSFGQGFGEGEPVYESPEQALSIADMWANNETLRLVADLYGRIDPDMRMRRAKRVVGGADEIVDIKLGDNMRRVVASELPLLADPDFEDDFYMRLLSGELNVYDTVGEEHAGRGPIILVTDESMSMEGERNVWAKAVSLALLNIARREKRDFAYVAFASGRQVHSFEFPAKKDLDPQQIVDMASHFYNGGTTPVIGLAEAERVMQDKEFKKADIIMVSDGEAGFGQEDRRIRDTLESRGVRFLGIGIGGPFTYLNELTDDVLGVHDFDLDDPSEATAHLATHVT